MMDNKIILISGEIVSLSEWQTANNLGPDKFGNHFSFNDKKLVAFQPFTYAEPTLLLVDLFREEKGSAVNINSGFRTSSKQQSLIAEGYRASSFSPHEVGIALDVDTLSWKQTVEDVKTIMMIAKKLGFKIRVGYKDYWTTKKQTFFHFDTAPMYYAKGKPFYKQRHPIPWEYEQTW